MDDTAHLAAVLRPNGNHITAIAERYHSILQELVGGGVFDNIVKLGTDGILRCADAAAEVMQRDRGGVRHLL